MRPRLHPRVANRHADISSKELAIEWRVGNKIKKALEDMAEHVEAAATIAEEDLLELSGEEFGAVERSFDREEFANVSKQLDSVLNSVYKLYKRFEQRRF